MAAFGAIGDTPDEIDCRLSRDRRGERSRAAGERGAADHGNDRDVRRRRAMAAAAGGKSEHHFRDDVVWSAGSTRVKAREWGPGRRRAARRENGGDAASAVGDRDERAARECVRQAVAARQLAVQVAREAVARDEDMRLAPEAPAKSRAWARTGTCQ